MSDPRYLPAELREQAEADAKEAAFASRPEITEEEWAKILKGRKYRSRSLVDGAQVVWAGRHAKSCGACAHTHMHGDPRRGWCVEQRHMVSLAFPVLCRDFKPSL